MSTVSTLTLRRALADPGFRASLVITALALLATGGLVLVVTWLRALATARARACPGELDWLVVCGHLLEASGQPSPIYRARLARGAALAEQNPQLCLLLAGGGRPSEAAAGRQWLAQ